MVVGVIGNLSQQVPFNITQAGTYIVQAKVWGYIVPTMEEGWIEPDPLNAIVYVVDDVVPSVPSGLSVAGSTAGYPVELSWSSVSDDGLDYYQLARRYIFNGSVAGSWSVIASTESTSYTDTDWQYASTAGIYSVEYKIRAKDVNDNYSSYSSSVSCEAWPLSKKGAELVSSNVPTEFTLSNYPNPFNPTTNITYAIPERGHVQLKVYDVLGNEVVELVNDNMEVGSYRVSFDGSNLASGIYIVNLQTPAKLISQKIMLMK